MKPSKWTECTVREIASPERNALVGGPFGSDLVSKDYVSSGVPVIRGANMGKGRWVSGDFVFVSQEKADSLSSNCAKAGDLVYTQRGTIGQVAVVPNTDAERYLISQSQMKLTVDPTKADALFLFYVFSGREQQDYIQLNAIRTGVPHTNLSILRNTPVKLPNLAEQKAIAGILSALDSKIELNHRINGELEGVAKLLYDYWFVQYDFPLSAAQAAALGKPRLAGQPYRTSGGKMLFNPTLKREIPKGWEVGSLNCLGEIVGGSTPSTQEDHFFSPQGIPWITPKDLSRNTGNKFITRGEVGVTDKGIKGASLTLLPAGTVLMSSRAPIGYTAIARNPVTTNQGFKSFVPSKGYSTEFIYYTLNHLMKTIEQNASGSTFKEVSGGTLKSIQTQLPEPSNLSEFSDLMQPIFSQQDNIERQNQELTALRDWLLPMLMNGQVRVG